jgi:hypothetical protein
LQIKWDKKITTLIHPGQLIQYQYIVWTDDFIVIGFFEHGNEHLDSVSVGEW